MEPSPSSPHPLRLSLLKIQTTPTSDPGYALRYSVYSCRVPRQSAVADPSAGRFVPSFCLAALKKRQPKTAEVHSHT